MSDQSLIEEITAWAVDARYDQTPLDTRVDVPSRQAAAREVLLILAEHGVTWSMDEAMKVIPAPAVLPYNGTCSHGKLNREFCVECHPRPVTMIPTVVRG